MSITGRNASIAQAVVDGLNATAAASGFPASFVAIRRYDPLTRRTDLVSLLVSVAATSDLSTRITRATNQDDIVIAVGLEQKMKSGLDPATTDPAQNAAVNAEIDAFLLTCEAVSRWFAPGCISLDGVGSIKANFEGRLNDPDWLRTHRIMINVVIATFRFIERASWLET